MELSLERRKALEALAADMSTALEALAADVSTADLNRVLSVFPYLISEAVRELNGEVRYVAKRGQFNVPTTKHKRK